MATKGNLEDFDPEFNFQVRALINSKMREFVNGKGNVTRLAIKCGLSVGTLSKLAYYETTRPQWRTIIAIARGLEFMTELGMLMVHYGKSLHETYGEAGTTEPSTATIHRIPSGGEARRARIHASRGKTHHRGAKS